MGCDIHMWIEYKPKERVNADREYWNSFGKEINPGRDYAMFGYLAGVRHHVTPVVEPRGIPDDLGYMASQSWWLYIDDTIESEEFCTLAKAREWTKYGKKIVELDGKPYKVEHPDTHTPSYVTPDELEKAMKWCAIETNRSPGDAYYAMLAACRALEERSNDVRITFWFDN